MAFQGRRAGSRRGVNRPRTLECILSVDIGSSTTRATLFQPETSRFYAVEDATHVYKHWQKDCFSPAEFPTTGRLKRGNPVGADAFGYHDTYPLKYVNYELSNPSDEKMNEYAPLEIFRPARSDPKFHSRLRGLFVAFLKMIKERVDSVCGRKQLSYATLVFTMPSQWGGRGNPVHDTFESLIREVWTEESFPLPIQFVFEIEALAHSLIHEAARELQQYDQIMLMDCGGHITAFSLFELRWAAQPDEHSPPPFYQVGDSHSCFGGSEYWIYLVGCAIDEELRQRHIAVSSQVRFELLNGIRSRIVATRCWEADSSIEIEVAGKKHQYQLAAAQVKRCFDRAFDEAFQHVESMMEVPDKNTLLVIHGGSALHPLLREELLKRARAGRVTTRMIYHDKVELSRRDTVFHVVGQNEPEQPTPRKPGRPKGWRPIGRTVQFSVDILTQHLQTMAVSHGAALAVAFNPSIADYLSGAAIGIQVQPNYGATVLLANLDKDEASASAIVAVRRRLDDDDDDDDDLLDMDADTSEGYLHQVNLICDPVFPGLRTMRVQSCYNLWEVGELETAEYRFDLRCDVPEKTLYYSHLRVGDPEWKAHRMLFSIYIDPGDKCLHVDPVETSNTTPMGDGHSIIQVAPSHIAAEMPGRNQGSAGELGSEGSKSGELQTAGHNGNNDEYVQPSARHVHYASRPDDPREAGRHHPAVHDLIDEVVQSAVAFLNRHLATIRNVTVDGGGGGRDPNQQHKGSTNGTRPGSSRTGQANRGGLPHHRPNGRNSSRQDNSGSSGDDDDPEESQGSRNPRISRAARNLACPFWRLNPARFTKYCSGKGYPTINRLKQHLYHRHSPPAHVCPRCRESFATETELNQHSAAEAVCRVSRSTSPGAGGYMSSGIKEQLKSKRRMGCRNEEEKWRYIFHLLFPSIPESDIPCCYRDDPAAELGSAMRGQSASPQSPESGDRHARFIRLFEQEYWRMLSPYQQSEGGLMNNIYQLAQEAVRAAHLKLTHEETVVGTGLGEALSYSEGFGEITLPDWLGDTYPLEEWRFICG